MGAEKAAAYPASSVRFCFFLIIFLFLFWRFLAAATNKQLITFALSPLSRSTAKIRKLLHFCSYFNIKRFLETLKKSCSLCSFSNALKLYAVTSQLVFLYSLLL